MRETINQMWAVIENEPGFQDVPLLLGLFAAATIAYLVFGIGIGGGDGGGGDGCGGGDGG